MLKLTMLEFCLLAILQESEEKVKAASLHRKLEIRLINVDVSIFSVHVCLHRMVKKGYIAVEAEPRAQAIKRSNLRYNLLPKGNTLLEFAKQRIKNLY